MSRKRFPKKLITRFKPEGIMIFLTLAIWMCTLPLLFVIVLPFLGWRWTGLIAVVILMAEVVACWALCLVNIYREAKTKLPGEN